jgi:pimeloyl-ACP methyl ester carboxylesterase
MSVHYHAVVWIGSASLLLDPGAELPGARLQVFERSGHLTMHDETEAYVQAIREFLRQVEGQ